MLCFEPGALAVVGSIIATLNGVIVFLYRGWMKEKDDRYTEAMKKLDIVTTKYDRMRDAYHETAATGQGLAALVRQSEGA